MKKFILAFSIVLTSAVSFAQNGEFPTNSIMNPSISFFRVSASVGIESEYVFRGEKLSGIAIQPKVEFSYPVAGFDLYAGGWMNSPVNNETNKNGELANLKEIDLYAGLKYSYGPMVFDVGAIYYWYPSGNFFVSRNYEAYAGITFDTSSVLSGYNINPSVYYFYDFVLQKHTVEASLGYDTPIGKMLLGNGALTLPIRAFYGYAHASRANGDQSNIGDLSGSYQYWGASIDVAYSITEYCTISAGVRYSQLFSPTGDGYGDTELAQRNLWWGAKVDFGF